MTDRSASTEYSNDTSPLAASGLLAKLGATIPLVSAPMAGGPSTPALVLSAAEAGGLGMLAGGYKSPKLLAEQITEVRTGISTFGVNLFGANLFAPNPVPIDKDAFVEYTETLRELAATYDLSLNEVEALEDDDEWAEKVDMLVSDPVPVVSFTFGLPPAEAVRRLQKAGSLVFQTVTKPDEAQQAADLGVDGLVVQSYKAGGHSGTLTPGTPIEQIPLAQLLDRVRSRTTLPMWAAGGISTPNAVREALAHGAEAAVLGSVLLRSDESGASKPYKAALADPRRTETVLTTAFSGRPARALRNDFVDQFHGAAPSGYPAIHHLTSPIRKAAAAANDSENINIWAGTGYRDATEEPTVVIMRRLAAVR
ncbi:NAD(P)H-dependent flavin oxidoreductase [Glutamicibacter sp. AOP5-A2-18]|uniref:NAD(P)H-dependent flavin oxidoreductase n=1 Tax=Glutamicibacter sp. AOP5-A2-18 TaxID=3457656 RepID=UPI0040341817